MQFQSFYWCECNCLQKVPKGMGGTRAAPKRAAQTFCTLTSRCKGSVSSPFTKLECGYRPFYRPICRLDF